MSDRTKEIILKTVIVIGFSAMLFVVPGAFVYCWFLSEKVVTALIIIGASIFGVFGVILMILLPIFGLKQKPVKAKKIAVHFDDYNSLEKHIQESAQNNGYTQQPSLTFLDDGTLTTYVKPNGLWKKDCIALIRISELTDDILNSANDAITESLKAYYAKERITDTVDMITIFCVDRITPTFQKLVNSNIQQGLKNGRLPVGISFGGKSIYIARQKDGFAITKYKKLRKEFLKIMDL